MSLPISRRLPRTLSLGLALAGMLLAGTTPGCASAGTPIAEIAPKINATLDPAPARFLPGDKVELRFKKDFADYDQTVQVDLEGGASFLRVGRMQVLAKSAEQVQQELAVAYSQFFSESPGLSVNLLGPNPDTDVGATNRPIHVLGEVNRPGPIPLLGRHPTLVEALSSAGSFDKRTALLKQVLLVRWMPDDGVYRSWKIDARPEHWRSKEQVLLQAFDVVYVPQTPIDKVDIWVDQYIRQLLPFPYLIPPLQ